jgi:hypothetical protein
MDEGVYHVLPNNRMERRVNDKMPSSYGVSARGAHAER